MAMALLCLPQDILLGILLFLCPEDLLVLSQTCRTLHEYTSTDYLWHQLATQHLPLDIEPYVDRNHLPGPILKAIVTRALRVDHNWRRPDPQIRKLTRLAVGLDNVSQMHFIGSHWLVVLRRSPPSLSVWRVDSEQPYRAAFINLLHHTGFAIPLKFAAIVQKGCSEVLIALISEPSASQRSGTILSAYSVALKSHLDTGTFAPPSPHAILNLHRPESEGRFYEIHVCGDIIAVGILQFVNHVLSPAGYRILFINSVTGIQCLIDPEAPAQLTQLHFKVYSRQFVLAGICNQSTIFVRTYDLPAAMLKPASPNSSLPEPTILVEPLTTPNAEYESPAISDVDYWHLSADSTHNISHISSISFHSLAQRAKDYIFYFPLDRTPCRLDEDEIVVGKPSFVCPFNTHPTASAEMVCLGETGSRAVWLQHGWTNDEYTLMKAAFSPNGKEPAVVQPLLARHLALPFELHRCQSLAFEESTGRVCLAVHTGELYMLQF
ncbi:hypothetical protein B0H19DRAFT_1188469 [Mycena capillaripes]|nr:hypothetical protein B0H19DRAFT_1188469 [Mycena capillaripes]